MPRRADDNLIGKSGRPGAHGDGVVPRRRGCASEGDRVVSRGDGVGADGDGPRVGDERRRQVVGGKARNRRERSDRIQLPGDGDVASRRLVGVVEPALEIEVDATRRGFHSRDGVPPDSDTIVAEGVGKCAERVGVIAEGVAAKGR